MVHRLRVVWWQWRRPTTRGARIILTDENGAVCLVRHSYGSGWYLPDGGLRRGEEPEDGARREAMEELGVDVELDGLVGTYASTAEGKRDTIWVFAARFGTPPGLVHGRWPSSPASSRWSYRKRHRRPPGAGCRSGPATVSLNRSGDPPPHGLRASAVFDVSRQLSDVARNHISALDRIRTYAPGSGEAWLFRRVFPGQSIRSHPRSSLLPCSSQRCGRCRTWRSMARNSGAGSAIAGRGWCAGRCGRGSTAGPLGPSPRPTATDRLWSSRPKAEKCPGRFRRCFSAPPTEVARLLMASWSGAEVTPRGSCHEGRHYVRGVPVQRLAGTVVPHGRAGIGMGCRLLHIS
jgi:8-oxo-dGTP pyrophosphatase MutT (NUDIX family)